jgi:hypothetical protein
MKASLETRAKIEANMRAYLTSPEATQKGLHVGIGDYSKYLDDDKWLSRTAFELWHRCYHLDVTDDERFPGGSCEFAPWFYRDDTDDSTLRTALIWCLKRVIVNPPSS